MKKIVTLITLAALLTAAGCRRAEIKSCSAFVEEISDTAMTGRIGDYKIAFNIQKARYTNGAVMAGDSAVIHYIGDLRSKRVVAAVIRLIPPKGTEIKAGYDPAKELKTAPASKESVSRFKEFVNEEKARRAAER